MKTNELKRLLRERGCILLRQGARHEAWTNPQTGAVSFVPRHNAQEIPTGTLQKILKTLLG